MKCLATLLINVSLFAQEMPNNAHQATLTPQNARYELVLSQWLRRQEFKLDRFSGRVWQIVVDEKKNRSWEEMEVDGRPVSNVPPHPHFQIVLSGYMASDAFLIDNDTGRSWELVVDTQKLADGSEAKIYSWQLMPTTP